MLWIHRTDRLLVVASLVLSSHAAAQAESFDGRTPIGSLPYTITESGSYLLTTQLTGSQGITVDATNVTIDLNGFSLIGQNASGDAISTSGGSGAGMRLTVRNGNIANWGGWGVRVDEAARYQVIEDLAVTACSGGIRVSDGSKVSNCTLNDIDGVGIDADEYSILSDCVVLSSTSHGYNFDSGTILQNCIAGSVGGKGFNALSTARENILTNCVSRFSASDGFQIDRGSILTSCTSSSSGADGFNLDYARLVDCIARGNSGYGYDLDFSQASRCSAFGNGEDGFQLRQYSTVADSQATGNGDNGFSFHGIGSMGYGINATGNSNRPWRVSSSSVLTFIRQHRGAGNVNQALDEGTNSDILFNW